MKYSEKDIKKVGTKMLFKILVMFFLLLIIYKIGYLERCITYLVKYKNTEEMDKAVKQFKEFLKEYNNVYVMNF